MIAYVSGTLVEKRPTAIVIDVQGIGYRVLIPTSTFEKLPPVSEQARVYTYHYVREDALLLYGFASEAERAAFETMLSVSGVGPRLALAALSSLAPHELQACIIQGDLASLSRIPGVGKKTAQRMVIELKDRFMRLALDRAPAVPGEAPVVDAHAQRNDATAALEALGLSRSAAEKSLAKVLRAHPDVSTAEELVRLALREA